MSWDFAPAFDAAHRAVLASGKPLVYVCAPASWPVVHLFANLPHLGTSGLGTLVLVPTTTDALDLGDALQPVSGSRPVHALTGLVRGERLLRADGVGTLVGTPADILYLLSRSALKSDQVSRVAVVWPEAMLDAGGGVGGGGGSLNDLDVILGDAPKAHRLIITSDEASAAGVIERVDNHVLIALSLPGGSDAQRWCFPRGRVERGESPEAAMRRIARDDLGLEVEIVIGQPPLPVRIDGEDVEFRYFICGVTMDEVRSSRYPSLRWVLRGRLREYDFDEASKPVVTWLLEPDG